MATETTVPMDDKELFSAATSDDAAEVNTQVEAPVVEAKDDGPVRDEQGRFAPKEEKQPDPVADKSAVTVEQTTAQTEANVPSWRLREVNEAKEAAERRAQDFEARTRAYERQLADLQKQQQPKAEAVDFFTDPNAAFQQRLDPIEAQRQADRQSLILRVSRAEAVSEYGKPVVSEMEKAIEEEMRAGNPELPALSARMRSSDDPIGVAMNWYRNNKLMKETGGDLNSYRQKLQDELLKSPEFLTKAIEAVKAQAGGQGSTPNKSNSIVQLPPSLSRATSAASPHEDTGDMSDRGLFAYATK